MVSAGCTPSTNQTAENSPSTSPSQQASPSASPSTSPSTTPSETPSASPSASPSPTAPFVNAVSYHAGEVGIPYTPVTATAGGGTPGYVWGVSGGTLPPGLVMSSGGTLSGTPTTDGTYSFVVIVQDSAGKVGGLAKTITVARRMSATGSCARLCSVEAGCFNVCGSLGSIDGGARPYKATLISGTVPKGMGLAPLALTGTFPTSPSSFSLSVLITDALGATASVGANFSVFPHISVSTDGTSCIGYGCQLRFPYSLGTPNSTPTLTISNVLCKDTTAPYSDPANYGPCNGVSPEPPANTLPGGFSAVLSGGEVVITFGSPGTYGDWFGSFVLTLTDPSPCSASGNCFVSVTIDVDNNRNYG